MLLFFCLCCCFGDCVAVVVASVAIAVDYVLVFVDCLAVVQVGWPEGRPHQAEGAQGSPHPGQTLEVGLRRSGRQRSQISPYQAGSSGMEGKSDKFG